MSAPRILVVEDSPTQARLLRLILEAEGFAVDVAGDGQAALARLAAAPFDLVVSDVLMPGLTGFELCRTIKADPALCEIPVVLVTTLREPQEIVQALEVGADSFIRKPYEPDALVARLRSLLAQRAHAAARTSRPRRAGAGRTIPRSRGVAAVFNGKTIDVHANREQILRLLLGTFEDVVRANTLLREREEELSVAKRDLEEAARMKDIFFATLSHELRTPLTAIVGWVHILKEGQTDPGRDPAGRRDHRAQPERAEHADRRPPRRLADRLRQARPGDGGRWTSPRSSGRRVDSARPTAAANGIALEVVLAPISAPISGDPARLQQVVTNLLTNSLKFTPRGGTRGGAPRPGEDEGGPDGDRLGVGDPARGPALRVRALPPGFDRRHQGGRARPGPGHRQAHRGDARGHGDGGQRRARARARPSP